MYVIKKLVTVCFLQNILFSESQSFNLYNDKKTALQKFS